MSETTPEQVENATAKQFKIEISISEQNLSYKSDFSEPETIFWIESVKNIILNKTFDGIKQESWFNLYKGLLLNSIPLYLEPI